VASQVHPDAGAPAAVRFAPGSGPGSRPGGLGARLLRQDLGQVEFGPRRFRLRGGPARERLEESGRAFLEGFNRAVGGRRADRLHQDLAQCVAEFRGFAYEGAGMGCALLDLLTVSGGRRLRELMDGPGAGYPHLIHVGVGWAFARLRLRPWHALRAGEPLLRWLAWDGFGFHQGFFASDRVVGCQKVEAVGPARRAIRDQGLGRSLWFHECAEPEALALRVALFPEPRRADLWSGIGLAATYAGGAAQDELRALADFAAPYAAHLAQGAVFGAAARLRAPVPLPQHCGEAVQVLAGVDAHMAAGWADAALEELGPDAATVTEYEGWRAGIRQRWAQDREQREQWDGIDFGRSA
jgi:hypothetical protein